MVEGLLASAALRREGQFPRHSPGVSEPIDESERLEPSWASVDEIVVSGGPELRPVATVRYASDEAGQSTVDLTLPTWGLEFDEFLGVTFTTFPPPSITQDSPTPINVTRSTSDDTEGDVDRSIQEHRSEILTILNSVESDLSAETFKRLRARLEILLESDDEPSVRINTGSFKHFLKLLRQQKRLRCPAVFITDQGNIKAQWQVSKEQLFWIEFMPSGDVTYLAFFPNKNRTNGVERQLAHTSVSDVMDRAQTIGALKWLNR